MAVIEHNDGSLASVLFRIRLDTAFFGISADCDIHIHILLNYISFKFKTAAYSRKKN